MSDSKFEKLKSEVPKILQEYEKEGITKNSLCVILAKKRIATRATFYQHLSNLKKDGIIDIQIVKNQQEKCFPTSQYKKLTKLEEKLEIANQLVEALRKDPLTGDCFASDKAFKTLPLISHPKISKLFETSSQDRFMDTINTDKPSPKGYFPTTHIYSLTARRDILKELPSFLIHFVNHPDYNYPIIVRQEFLKIMFSIVMKCLEILQRDYLESFSYSNYFKNELSKLLPANEYAFIYTIRKESSPNIMLEFVKILGRYYSCISNQDEKQQYKQKIISSFIESFYHDFLLKDQLDQYVKEHNIEKDMENGVIPPSLIEEHSFLRKVQNSISWKLIDPLVVNWDPDIVKDNYMQFFIEEDLFSKFEKKIWRKKHS